MFRKRERLQFNCVGPSKTKQQFKEECDVNNILKKYNKTRLLTHVNKNQGSYGDFSNITDYQTSLNAIKQAEEAFLGLPAALRKKFNNNPTEIVDFLTDNTNYEEAYKLGLLHPTKAQAYKQQQEAKLQSQSPKEPPTPQATKNPKNDD